MFTRQHGKSIYSPGPSSSAVLEPLESRTLLSGTVTVALLGGNLVLTGDAADNGITLTGGSTSAITITGTGGTAISGPASVSSADVRGGIIFNMLNGNDTVLLDALFTTKKVTVDGGDGNNTVTVQNGQVGGILSVANGDAPGGCVTVVANELLGKDLKIAGRSGAAGVHIVGGTRIGGGVTVTSGSAGGGSHVFSVSSGTIARDVTVFSADGTCSQTFTMATLGGTVRITNGAGADNINFAAARIKKAITVNTGDGGGSFNFTSGTVGGNVSFTAGAGVESFALSSCMISRSLTGSLGAGASSFSVSTLTVGEACKLSSLGGLSGGGSMVNVGGALSVDSGEGDMHLSFGVLNVGGSVAFTSRGADNSCSLAGSDIWGKLSYAATGANELSLSNVWAGKMTYLGGDGADNFTLQRINLGGLTADLGNGNNTLTLDDSIIAGATSIRTGSGVDTVNIETTSSEISVFGGNTRVLLGDGDDTLVIGQAANPQRLAIFSKASQFDGQGGTNTNKFYNVIYGGATTALNFT